MITTPRGIVIPLSLDSSFCLISRLYPKVKPYTVLETTAGFYKMHGTVGFITGILCFLLHLLAWQIAAITFIATLVGYAMSVLAIYPPGLLRLARIYSLLTGYGLILVGLSIFGVCTVGILATGMFWISRLIAEFVTIAHAQYMGRKALQVMDPPTHALAKRLGIKGGPDGFAIRCFGNAYATYARKYGVPIEAIASTEELESGQWQNVLKEFAQEWPMVVKRFHITDEEWNEILHETTSQRFKINALQMNDQRDMAEKLYEKDPELAIRIAMGEEDAPDGIMPEAIYGKVCDEAEKSDNLDVCRQLANSDHNLKISADAQNLEFRNPDSAIEKMKEVVNARRKEYEKTLPKKNAIMNFKEAQKVVSDYGGFIEYAFCRFNTIFLGCFPQSLLPYPPQYIEDASNIVAKYYYDKGDKKAVENIQACHSLMAVEDDEKSILFAVKMFQNKEVFDSIVEYVTGFRDKPAQRNHISGYFKDTPLEKIDFENPDFSTAYKIITIYSEFLKYAHIRLSFIFCKKIPESLLPFPKKHLIKALDACSIGDDKNTKSCTAGIAFLEDYVDDDVAISELIKNFSDKDIRDSIISDIKDFQDESVRKL